MNRVVQNALVFIAFAPLVAFAPSRVEAVPVLLPAGTPNQSLAITAAADYGAASPGSFLAQATSVFSIASGTSGYIVGSLTSAVFRNAQGFVDFYYQVTNSTTSTNLDLSISGLTGFDFGGSTTSVGYYSDATVFGGVFAAPTAGVVPQSADRTADGSMVTLWFGPPWDNKVFPGQISSILQIATNATTWGAGFATVQNHGVATVNSFQVSPVPEPEIYAMMAVGLGLLGWVRHRKKLKEAAPA